MFSFIARRYLFGAKKSFFVNLLSYVCMGGVALSVCAFIIIHSVMNGFGEAMRESLIGFNAHVTLSLPPDDSSKINQYLENDHRVKSYEEVSDFDGIIQLPFERVSAVKVRGMDMKKPLSDEHLQITYFDEHSAADMFPDGGLPGILIGEELMIRLQLIPGQEVEATLLYPFGDVGPSGEMEPTKRNFRIVGIFSTGFYQYDLRYVLIDNDQAAYLTTAVSKTLLVKLDDESRVKQFKQDLERQFPEIKCTTWEDQNKRLFSALQLEKMGMFLLLSMVMLIATFNILSLINLFAYEKVRDMAVLFTLGGARSEIKKIYWNIGLTLGIVGTVIGILLSLGILFWLKTHELSLPPGYYLQILPVAIDWKVVLGVGLLAPLCSVFAALWPAKKAAQLKPIEILRST